MTGRGFIFSRKRNDGKVVEEAGKEVISYPDAQLPEYQTKHSAGADFFCAEEVIIPSIWRSFLKSLIITSPFMSIPSNAEEKLFKPTIVHTGISAFMEEDEVLELYNRSSNPLKKGLVLANGVGVVDSDYFANETNDGEIGFAFYNFYPWDITIKVGDRIGQGVFKKFLRPTVGLRIKDEERKSGFGSTDGKGTTT